MKNRNFLNGVRRRCNSRSLCDWRSKRAFVQTEKGALYLLLAVAGTLLLIALFIVFSGDGSAPSRNPYVEGQNVLLPPGATIP